MMQLALQHLLDFVLDGAEAKLIRAAGPHTPELPQMLLQARALVELLVGGPEELGPEVRKRLAIAQRSIRRPRPDRSEFQTAHMDAMRVDYPSVTRAARSELRYGFKASVRNSAAFESPDDSNRITHAQASLSASSTPLTARVELERLVIELRRSDTELLPTLVVDLSLSPKRSWDGGWVLWFPPAEPAEPGTALHPVRRARFDDAGVAQLPWPSPGRGALRVDADRAALINLEITA